MARIIIGFMGSGKTTISSLLDEDYVDMDAVIVERIGMPIADFFEKEGEARFREIESQVLAELIASDRVIATGGGIVTSAANRALLAENPETIYLKADFDTLYNRIQKTLKMCVRYLSIIAKKTSRRFLMGAKTCTNQLPTVLLK